MTTEGHTIIELLDPHLPPKTRPSLFLLNHYFSSTLPQTTLRLKSKHTTTPYDLHPSLLTRFSHITHLDVSHCRHLDDSIFQILVFFPQLSYLDLSHVKRIGGKLFGRVSVLENLRTLKLNNTAVSDRGLVGMRGLKDLKELEVSYCEISGSGFGDIEWGIEVLIASNCGLRDLSGISQMSLLRYLDISMIPHFTTNDFGEFHRLTQLETLHLSFCEGLDDLSGIGMLHQLKVLSIAWCDLHDDCILQLSKLVQLNTLDISGNTHLSAVCTAWLSLNNVHLRRLDISGCSEISDEGMRQLIYLPHLKDLNVIECNVSESLVSSLRISHPDLSIFHESTI